MGDIVGKLRSRRIYFIFSKGLLLLILAVISKVFGDFWGLTVAGARAGRGGGVFFYTYNNSTITINSTITTYSIDHNQSEL